MDISASIALALPWSTTIPMSSGGGTFTYWAFPARLAAGWVFPMGGRLTVAPTLAAGIDVVRAQTRGIGLTRQSIATEPTVEAGLRADLALTRRTWIDLQAFQGVDLRPEVFYVTGAALASETLLMTPRTYTRLSLNFGVFLGKSPAMP